jgi:hypothetical protein
MKDSEVKNKVGRPKGVTPPKKLVTLRLEPSKLEKVSYIAWYQRDSITDVIDSALDLEIKKFEKANGSITDEQIQQAFKKK